LQDEKGGKADSSLPVIERGKGRRAAVSQMKKQTGKLAQKMTPKGEKRKED